MAAYILGEISYEEAVEAIKKNTRRFARRRLTWFRAEPDWTWIDVGGKTPEQTAEAIMGCCRRRNSFICTILEVNLE